MVGHCLSRSVSAESFVLLNMQMSAEGVPVIRRLL